jgi:hypothetical protein
MSMDTTTPALPSNAAQESGGNLDTIKVAETRTIPDLLAAILLELQILNALCSEDSPTRADPAKMRNDSSFPT